jgi:hypothetical protein
MRYMESGHLNPVFGMEVSQKQLGLLKHKIHE